MPGPDINELITRAARAELHPIGCVQRGRSRIWLDDHRWWVTVVEFQPSSGSKGTYLNVGACWLWHTKDYFTFDDGYRVDSFQSARNLEGFADALPGMAAQARVEVLKCRARFPTVHAVAEHLTSKAVGSPTIWDHYHAGIANGLAGRFADAERHLRTASGMEAPEAEWVSRLKAECHLLLPRVGNASVLREVVANAVAASREVHKLMPLAGNVFSDVP